MVKFQEKDKTAIASLKHKNHRTHIDNMQQFY